MESSIRRRLSDNGTATVFVHGEIDFANCDELAECVRQAVLDWSPPAVRVEVRAATFIDSTGLGALIEGYKATVAIGSRFVVTNPTPVFRRVLEVTGLTELFGLAETEAEIGVEATGT
jgi:anti-sigma B factor antagonist